MIKTYKVRLVYTFFQKSQNIIAKKVGVLKKIPQIFVFFKKIWYDRNILKNKEELWEKKWLQE